jgi:hydroxymethylpyrimidine/phosphomethylpyrimidine kinase
MPDSPVPRCLTIAGSDSGGGAGIQADLKAFAAAGCHGMTAIVALTAQNTVGVADVLEVPPPFVRTQLEAVFSDLGVDAAKTGMLFSAAIVETVADFLADHPVPLVVDPVMVASSGARLLRGDAVEALVTRLFPLATVVTPNVLEAQALTAVTGLSLSLLCARQQRHGLDVRRVREHVHRSDTLEAVAPVCNEILDIPGKRRRIAGDVDDPGRL